MEFPLLALLLPLVLESTFPHSLPGPPKDLACLTLAPSLWILSTPTTVSFHQSQAQGGPLWYWKEAN